MSRTPQPTLAKEEQHIVIALCTYNGARFLEAQLQSYVQQRHTNWSLWVSDDGSTDDTLDILYDFQRNQADSHSVHIIRGPGQGVCANFLSLLCHPEFPKSYVALSDQDDVWMPGKLACGLHKVSQVPALTVLYGAQSHHTDLNLRPIGTSHLARSCPEFRNALVQNVVSGHSIILSPQALELVRSVGVPESAAFHDWWLYQLITGAGGHVILDEACVLQYRQHSSNLMGASRGLISTVKRMGLMRQRIYKQWMSANTAALWAARAHLTDDAVSVLNRMQQHSDLIGLRRVFLLRRIGVKRQTRFGTLALYLASALGLA